MGPSLSLVIPAYNEEESLKVFLPKVAEHCLNKGYELIVINDGSRDATAEVVEGVLGSKELRVLHHKVNRGYGAAIKTGVMAATTDLVITIDADGQHSVEDVDKLYQLMCQEDADMVVGSRQGQAVSSLYRGLGKSIIRTFAKLLMPIHIYDLNSGMKIYRTDLAQRYVRVCPDSMPYSDIITLLFINKRHRVLETPIEVGARLGGVSTINMQTAFQTVLEILHILIMFNPMRVFLPMSLICLLSGLLWGFPIILEGKGISTGAMLAIIAGLIVFFLGLIAEQLSWLRKASTEAEGAEHVNAFCGHPSRESHTTKTSDR